MDCLKLIPTQFESRNYINKETGVLTKSEILLQTQGMHCLKKLQNNNPDKQALQTQNQKRHITKHKEERINQTK